MPMAIAIVDFAALSAIQIAQAAQILREALSHLTSGYQGPGEAETEVESRRSNSREWVGLAALDGEAVAGWTGAIRSYSHGWELHPLVVDPRHQRLGIGSALLAAMEARARAEGVITLYLGSDDDHAGTNLYGRNLFPNVLEHAGRVEAAEKGHAITFYRRHGYQVVGLLPDVNGEGRPDIVMAKRLRNRAAV
jgi:aminoglycoside 6'-N-acetyltransferase I